MSQKDPEVLRLTNKTASKIAEQIRSALGEQSFSVNVKVPGLPQVKVDNVSLKPSTHISYGPFPDVQTAEFPEAVTLWIRGLRPGKKHEVEWSTIGITTNGKGPAEFKFSTRKVEVVFILPNGKKGRYTFIKQGK